MEQRTIIKIGRKTTNDIVLNNTDVSGEHAKLTLIDPKTERWLLEDLNSTGGTKVNDNAVLRREVTPIDEIVLGNTVMDWKLIKEPIKILTPDKIGEYLYDIDQQYNAKKAKLDQLREAKETNAANRLLGGILAGASGSLFVLMPSLKQYAAFGGIIPLAVFLYTIYNSKIINKNIRKIEPVSGALEKWHRSHHICLKCHTPFNETYEILLKSKTCRNCKQRLMP